MKFLRWAFGRCLHANYTWPQGRGVQHVACLDCGADLPYSWEEMRILSEKEAIEMRAEANLGEWLNQARIDNEVERILSK